MKKKVFRAFRVFGITAVSLIVAGVLSFWLLIVVGLSPKLQTIWICSAMRTMSHKYLATAFFSDEYIAEIMEKNEIDDSGYDSEILSFSSDSDVKEDVKETEADTVEEPEPNENDEPPLETEAEIETENSEVEEVESEPEIIEEETDEEEADTEEDAELTVEEENTVTQDPAPETEAETEGKNETEVETIKPEEKTEEPDYISEGYELLEEGLYLKEVSGLTWRGYVMLVEDPFRVKLVDTSTQYYCGENVMTMTKNAGAVAGINGGGFQDGANYDSNGGTPAGLLIEDGKIVHPLEIDDTVYNMIGINQNGALVLRHCTAQWALDNGIVSAVSFAPFLVVNGEGLIGEGSGGWGIAPRTAIGQRKTGEFLFLVIDGRQVDWSVGCDLDVLQNVMLEEGAYNASMLDGGSSTAMVYNGEYVNRPSLGHERWINNCFVVMPKP